jgi:hypothetical protein
MPFSLFCHHLLFAYFGSMVWYIAYIYRHRHPWKSYANCKFDWKNVTIPFKLSISSGQWQQYPFRSIVVHTYIHCKLMHIFSASRDKHAFDTNTKILIHTLHSFNSSPESCRRIQVPGRSGQRKLCGSSIVQEILSGKNPFVHCPSC